MTDDGRLTVKTIYTSGAVTALVEWYEDDSWYFAAYPSVDSARKFAEANSLELVIVPEVQEVLNTIMRQ